MLDSAVPPIFVVTAEEVLVFRDVHSAARYMEPIDVRHGEYESVYDSVGRRLKPTVKRTARRLLSLFPVEASSLIVDDGPSQPGELATALRNFLVVLGHDRAGVDDHALEELVTKTVATAGYTV